VTLAKTERLKLASIKPRPRLSPGVSRSRPGLKVKTLGQGPALGLKVKAWVSKLRSRTLTDKIAGVTFEGQKYEIC